MTLYTPTKYKNTYNLMLVAHPDDELIFGGQELIENANYKVVCVSTDYNYRRRLEFELVMKRLGISDFELWEYEDRFHNPFSEDMVSDLETVIREKSWHKIVTHNPIGEYGHSHHRDLFLKVKSITEDFYVFCKEDQPIKPHILQRKRDLLNIYRSQKDVIKNMERYNKYYSRFINPKTDYIKHASISKYSPNLDITEYVNVRGRLPKGL